MADGAANGSPSAIPSAISPQPLAIRRLDGHEDLVAAAVDEQQRRTIARALDGRPQIVDRLHRLTVDRLDDVALTDARIGCASIRIDVLDHETVGVLRAQLLRELRRER